MQRRRERPSRNQADRSVPEPSDGGDGPRRPPRILIVNGQSINSTSATGITLSGLLGWIPRDNLLELCLYEGDLADGVRSRTLPTRTEPLRHLAKRFLGGRVISDRVNQQIRERELTQRSESVALRNRLKEVVNSYLDLGPVLVDPEVLEAAREFRPDIVYTSGSTVTIMRLAVKMARHCDCPMLLHFLDNWRESLYRGPLMALPRWVLRSMVSTYERDTPAGLAISDLMAAEYSRGGRTRYAALMNPIDTEQAGTPRCHQPDECTIVYTGGLHLRRHLPMLDVAAAVKRLNAEGLRCRLRIYTSERDSYVRPLFDPAWTTFETYVPHERIHETYAAADILVHVETSEPDFQSYIRYSISTKISEYMASARPILCYAPEATALHQHVRDFRVGLAVSTSGDLVTTLRRLVTDPVLRRDLGAAGAQVARDRHSLTLAQHTITQAVWANVDAAEDSRWGRDRWGRIRSRRRRRAVLTGA